MDIETIKPHPSLSKYIDFYYFIKNDSPKFHSTHYSFPHLINVVSIYKQAKFESTLGNAKISSDPANNYLSLLQAKCQVPLKVELIGKTNRISICFKTFGLNHFISSSLGDMMGSKVNQFVSWDADPKYHTYLDKCFATDNFQEKIIFIEQFLLSKLQPISTSYLEKSVSMLMNMQEDYYITDILKEINIPLRTFNRHFKEVLGISPIEFRRIARFRHSLDHKLFNQEFKRLTEIGYESHFYDQSYFNKIYQKLTGSNPKKFFNSVEKVADDRLIFKFIKK